MTDDLIINLTPTGMIPTRAMTPYVPQQADEIVRDVLECAEIGVTMVHLHARDTEGLPSWRPEIYAEIIAGIRAQRPDLILCVSTSGRTFIELEKRAAVLQLRGDLKPDMASLTLSSLNFNKQASINSPQMIADLARTMQDRGIKPELEAFDLGMINYARYLRQKDLLHSPYYFNLILGNIACAQADILHAGLMLKDLPAGSIWSFGGVGDWQLKMNMLAVLERGGVRVGLEDNIFWDGARDRTVRNADLVARIVEMAGLFGRTVMPPTKCRQLLGLKGYNDGFGVAE